MSTIAVVGATGVLGRPTVEVLRERGHDVRALSRSARGPGAFAVDLHTGAGLDAALEGADVVVDASNGGSRSAAARAVLVDGGRRLFEAERRAGVGHHVVVSIVGIERVPYAYYRVKLEQEALAAGSGVPWSIVRATQFHDLLATVFAATGRLGLRPTGRARLQTVDVREVASVLGDVAEGPPLHRRVTVAGPEVLELRDLGRTWARARGRRVVPVPLPPPGRLARALRGGALIDPRPDHRGTTSFGAWLDAQR